MLTFDIYKTSSSWSFCVCFFFMCPFVSPKDLEKQQVTGYWWTTSKRGSAANSASAPSAPSKKPNSLSRRIRKIIGPRTEPTSPRTPFRRPKKKTAAGRWGVVFHRWFFLLLVQKSEPKDDKGRMNGIWFNCSRIRANSKFKPCFLYYTIYYLIILYSTLLYSTLLQVSYHTLSYHITSYHIMSYYIAMYVVLYWLTLV